MATPGERILLVESDPDISDLIARQALRPLGYQVDVVGDAASAIKKAAQTTPDLILANLNLPGLSAKDLLVALSSQGSQTPVIVMAAKGQEGAALQAFRLGASDALFWPARDAEVVASVERALKQVRERRARQKLDMQLQETNLELDRKVRELTSLLAIGKAVTSITDQRVLFQKIVDGALQVSIADIGWLLLRDEHTKAFLLTSHRNLPEVWAKKMNEPLDDGISSLVALSGETLLIHGEPLQKFKVANLGKSAAVVPIKVQNEVIGLMLVVRKSARPFENVEQALLEAVADYASISLVNARLFRALEQTAESARNGERVQNALLESIREALREEMQAAGYPLELLMTEKPGKLSTQQKQALQTIKMALDRLARAAERTTPPAAKVK
ncbi:MAG: response regulator [Chloroflexota bacterium]